VSVRRSDDRLPAVPPHRPPVRDTAEEPTIDEVAENPSLALEMAPDLALTKLAKAAGAQAVLMVRAVTAASAPSTKRDTEPLLTAAEVAALLHVPKARVYELTRQGVLPAARIGKNVRFRRSEIDRWLEQNFGPTTFVRRRTRGWAATRSMEETS
jgi:excisionase family DNA binding protein